MADTYITEQTTLEPGDIASDGSGSSSTGRLRHDGAMHFAVSSDLETCEMSPEDHGADIPVLKTLHKKLCDELDVVAAKVYKPRMRGWNNA